MRNAQFFYSERVLRGEALPEWRRRRKGRCEGISLRLITHRDGFATEYLGRLDNRRETTGVKGTACSGGSEKVNPNISKLRSSCK